MTTTEVPDTISPYDDPETYDMCFGRIEYGLPYYQQLIRAAQARGPALDLACGTGRLLLPCLREGLDVDGIDLSQAMLARLKANAAEHRLKPNLWCMPMAGFSVPRKYAIIVITFNAFVHNLTADDQVATLERCRDHLLPGGMLAFDGFFPGAKLITSPEGQRELELETKDPSTGMGVRLFDTRSFDRVNQIMTSRSDVELLDKQSHVFATLRYHTRLRWIFKTEMELLLRLAKFARWQILGGFDGRPLTAETDPMVVEAWTKEAPNRGGHPRTPKSP